MIEKQACVDFNYQHLKTVIFFADYIILLCLRFVKIGQLVCPKKNYGNITDNVYLDRCY